METLEFTVFEDKSSFDRASDEVVREHFKSWIASAPQEEQGTTAGCSQRYRFCIQVDEGALQSVLDDDPDHILESDGWVKLLWADKRDIQPLPEYIINPCGPTDLRYPVKESPWVMVAVQGLLPGMYNLLREWDDWEREYRAPPEVLCL